MRIVFLGNNYVGWQVLKRLKDDEVVAIVLHADEQRSYGEELIATATLGPSYIFEADSLGDPTTLEAISDLKPDVAVSAFFGQVLRAPFMQLFPLGCINVHPSYLPFNRGTHPNVWSIVEGTPAGATIHFMDEGIDTGDIIARAQVDVLPTDTGETLYRKLEQSCIELFETAWHEFKAGTIERTPQPSSSEGTTHRIRDLARIDEIDLNGTYQASHLINILRARTFPPHEGCYFTTEVGRVYLRVQLMTEEEMETGAESL